MRDPHYVDDLVTVYHGDCLEVLAELPDASVDAVVTDPPYGLGFMGKAWDADFEPGDSPMRRSAQLDAVNAGAARQGGRQRAGVDYQRRMARDSRAFGEWCESWARECLRVLKPGGHLLAFGGTRTSHRLTCGIEDAGFEIRDGIAWLYGSGFPKSLDVSKAIDKAAGFEGDLVGTEVVDVGMQGGHMHTGRDRQMAEREVRKLSPRASEWIGWGTALKPAHEPVVVARKPLAGTVAANVLEYGTGALNVDACRVQMAEADRAETEAKNRHADFGSGPRENRVYGADNRDRGEGGNYDGAAGRWPANVALDESQAAELDRQSGVLTNGRLQSHHRRPGTSSIGFEMRERTGEPCDYGGDSGGASRYFPTFRYEAKARPTERPRDGQVAHPTVKPLDLMRWLVRLVTPPGGVVLDPFAGSGTTAEACVVEGFRCITIEREADYLGLIVQRLTKPIAPVLDLGEWSA